MDIFSCRATAENNAFSTSISTPQLKLTCHHLTQNASCFSSTEVWAHPIPRTQQYFKYTKFDYGQPIFWNILQHEKLILQNHEELLEKVNFELLF